jgi:glycosyltransferase involved in cell wall biosynthesis
MVQKISVLAPDLSGGGGTRVYLLAQVLQKLGYQVKVFGFVFGKKLYPPPPSKFTVEWVSGCNYPQFIASVWQLLKRIDGDILYAVKPRPSSFGVALIKRLQNHQPIILDIDDWELSWFGGKNWQYCPTPKQLVRDLVQKNSLLRDPNFPLYLQWMEQLIPQANALTVNTQFIQKKFGGTYLPNGKDINLFDYRKFDPEVSRQKYGLSDYRILMFPGTARPHKGIEDVLEALEILNQPDLRLVLVGGREIGDGYIENLVAQGKGWIVKLPQQSIEEMPEIVAAAHVIVVPQRQNPTAVAQFPIKLTDGMAMAKPILSTRVGDIPSILGDTGFLVNPNSPEQIAANLEDIFNNLDAANAKGMQGRKRCEEYYSLEAMAEIVRQVIESL